MIEQYTMEYDVPPGNQLAVLAIAPADVNGISDAAAYRIAYPLMRGAWEQRWYERTNIQKVGEGKQTVSRIGVVLYADASRQRGIRVSRTLGEIAVGLGE